MHVCINMFIYFVYNRMSVLAKTQAKAFLTIKL